MISIITQSSQRDKCFAVAKSAKSTKKRIPILSERPGTEDTLYMVAFGSRLMYIA